MKTEEFTVIFQEEDVRQFVQMLGDPNPIYKGIDVAQSYGFPTIPLPQTMPMIAYRQIDVPWNLQPPVIHRKQSCLMHQKMWINQVYRGVVTLEVQSERKKYTYIKQWLHLYDKDGILCFEGVSQLIVGGLT